MQNLPVMSIHASYLLALFVFTVMAWWRFVAMRTSVGIAPPPMPEGKVPVWFYVPPDLAGIGLFFLLYYGLAVLGASVEPGGNTGTLSAGDLISGIMVQVFAPAIALAIVVSRVNPVRWLGLIWREWKKIFAIAPLAVFGMMIFSVVLYHTGYGEMMETLGVGEEQEAVTLFREGQDPVVLLLMGFAAVIVAPVCEEMVFRGYIYPVAKKFAGPKAAAFCSALIFSAAHGNIAALLPLFVFGLLMVAVYELSGSIWAPVGVHMMFNGSTVLIQFLARYAELPEIGS